MRLLSMQEDPPATKTSSPQFPLTLSSLPSVALQFVVLLYKASGGER